MSSTLTLWRSLGIVMGVSISSLILQNTLRAYLNTLVTGHGKNEVRTGLSLACMYLPYVVPEVYDSIETTMADEHCGFILLDLQLPSLTALLLPQCLIMPRSQPTAANQPLDH